MVFKIWYDSKKSRFNTPLSHGHPLAGNHPYPGPFIIDRRAQSVNFLFHLREPGSQGQKCYGLHQLYLKRYLHLGQICYCGCNYTTNRGPSLAKCSSATLSALTIKPSAFFNGRGKEANSASQRTAPWQVSV